MGLAINLKKGITLQELNKIFSDGMKKYAEATSKTAKEVAECSGKSASEIAELTSKKDVVALSNKNTVMQTPFVEMDLRHNLAYEGLRGESANKVFADGSSMEINHFYDLKTGKISRKDNIIEFANGEKREIQEAFGDNAYKSVLSTNSMKNTQRQYQSYIDRNGRKISFVHEVDLNRLEGMRHATKGTIHIDGDKISFECIKNPMGQYTDAYKATIKVGDKTETLVFDNYKQLAERIGVPEHTFWAL